MTFSRPRRSCIRGISRFARLPRRVCLLGNVARQMVALDGDIDGRAQAHQCSSPRLRAGARLFELVLPLVNVFGLELGQPDVSEIRLDVSTDEDFVRGVCGRLASSNLLAGDGVVPRPNALAHPMIKPGPERQS